jgi:hypothetical protein
MRQLNWSLPSCTSGVSQREQLGLQKSKQR